MQEKPTSFVAITEEPLDIIDVIRNQRNDLIKDFLDERNLISYLSKQYKIMELSVEKLALVKNDLKELLIAPVDVERYKPVIEDYEANGISAVEEKWNEKIFYKEIENVLKKHLFS